MIHDGLGTVYSSPHMEHEVLPTAPSRPQSKSFDIAPTQREIIRGMLKEEKMEPYEKAVLVGIKDVASGKELDWDAVIDVEREHPHLEEEFPRPRFCSIFDRISRKVLDDVHPWPGATLEKKTLDGKRRAEIIVHPLYGLLRDHFNSLLWQRAKGDIETYLTLRLSKIIRLVAEKLDSDPAAIPALYLLVLDAVEEIEEMKKPPVPGGVRIYVMPNQSFLSPERRQAMSAILKKFASQDIVIDSVHDSTGCLQEKDLLCLKEHLKNKAVVELKGGYIDGCMDNCRDSLLKMGRTDIDPLIDYLPSTLHTHPKDDLRSLYPAAPRLLPPPSSIDSLADIITWIHKNDEFNALHNKEAVKRFAKEHPTKKLRTNE